MSAAKSRRRVNRSIQMFTAAVAAVAWSAEQSSALTINQWIGGSSNQWNNTNNWENGNIPNSGDIATVYNGTIGLNGTPPSVGVVDLLNAGGPTSLYTEGFKLNVLGALNMSGSTLVAQASSGSFSVQAPTLLMTDGAELTMIDSTAHVRVSSTTTGAANGTLSVDATSYIYTDGTIDTGTYTNNGALNAADPTIINATTFTQAGTTANPALITGNGNSMTIISTTFNLTDFNSKIDLSTANSSLSLQGTNSGNIGAEVDIGDTSTLTLSGGSWPFGYYQKSGAFFLSRGTVNLTGGPTLARAATITGEAAFFTSVNVTGYANLPSGPEFDGASTVTVNPSSFLYINGGQFRGASNSSTINFNGTGLIQNNGNMVIGLSGTNIPYTTVNINSGLVFNWDGTSGANASTTIENGELDIYSSTIDNSIFFPGYYGALTVSGDALLNVAGTAWTLYGTMTLGPGAVVQGQTLSIEAASVPAGSYSLMPTSSGTTFPVIQAPVAIYANSYIYMGFNGGLHLDGATTWAGGSVISAPYVVGNPPYGVLVQDGNATVTANTNIFCDILDMDGTANTATWTIDSGVTFTQQAFYLDTANSNNPFHSTLNLNGGIINMQTSAGMWTLVGGTINMNQSGSNNPAVEGDKLILGSGALKGTINAGGPGLSFVESPLQSAATTVAGGNVLNVGSGSTLYVNTFGSDAGAVLTKTGPGTAIILGPQSHAAGSQIIVSQGEMGLNTDAGGGGANLALNASGGTTVFNSLQRLSTLTIGSGATVNVTPVTFPNPRLVVATTLNMNGGTLNIGDNDVIAHNGNLTSLTASAKAGYDGGAWNGVGINSSNAASDPKHLHAVGVIQNATASNSVYFTTLDFQPAVITDVIIRYTYYGDANDDGKVDGSDYSRIDAAFLADKTNPNTATGWFNGDFNYDGITNGSDYTLIDNAFNSQGAQLADQVAAPTAKLASSGTAAVPEPASMWLIGVAAVGLLGRRRRVD